MNASKSNYAERCAKWLSKESPTDHQLIQKEIHRFSERLDKLQNTESEGDEKGDSVDDILATLQLLEDHLISMQPQDLTNNKDRQNLTQPNAEPKPIIFDTTPLVDLSIKPETIDNETKAKRLTELLSHPGIQKGFARPETKNK